MTYPTKRRTYSREQWENAQLAWRVGEFSGEWASWRHLAAMEAGIIDAPSGTKLDSWGDDDPSERALLIRAIRETPEALRLAITTPNVHAWSNVIAILTRGRDERHHDVERSERDDERRRTEEGTPRQATYALRSILDIVGQS